MVHLAIMEISMVRVGDLVPMMWESNPRKITDEDFNALRGSLRKWGCVEPVVVNRLSNRVVGGHQRIRAASDEAIESMPVVYVELDDDNEKALNIALNKISGTWELSLLAEVLSDLGSSGWDLGDLGFTDDELEDLVNEWKDPADLEKLTEYNADAETTWVRVQVENSAAAAVTECINAALTAAGYSYRAKAL